MAGKDKAKISRLPRPDVQPNDDPLIKEGAPDYSNGFIRVRNDWFEWAAVHLTHAEFRVAIAIMKWQEGKHPPINTIARQCGMKKRFAIRVLQRLEAKKAIIIERRARGLTNGYKINYLQISGVRSDTSAQLGTYSYVQECPIVHQGGVQSDTTPVYDRTPLNRSGEQTSRTDSPIERVSSTAESVVENRRADADAPLDTRSRVSSPTLTPAEEEERVHLAKKLREWLMPGDANDLTILREMDNRARARGMRL